MFKPNNIMPLATNTLLEAVHADVAIHARQLRDEDWHFYVVKQSRGRCYYFEKTITIPLWACDKGRGYITWYLAHEISHAETFIKHGGGILPHGKEFMEMLKIICPAEFLHFETNYKPKHANAAGISRSMYINTNTVPADF